jgi:hypothetical protein
VILETRKLGYELIKELLIFCCFDHDDVTWDSSKGESFGD